MKNNQGVIAERMSDRTLRITAQGNNFTSENQIFDYLMLKAAETTIELGGTHFVVTNAADLSRYQVVSSPGVFFGGVYVPPTASLASFPGATIIIVFGTPVDASAAALPGMIDAAEVVRNIGPRVYAAKARATVAMPSGLAASR